MDARLLRISPTSPAFIFLLVLLAVVPGFAVDMALPTLVGTSTSLRVAPSGGGLAIGCFMLSYGAAPLIYGPISNGYGRKPVLVFGCAAFVIACIGCALASSLPILLVWRVAQGAGAAAMTLSMVIISDIFKGSVAREKMSYLLIAIYVSPIIATRGTRPGFRLPALAGRSVVLLGFGAKIHILVELCHRDFDVDFWHAERVIAGQG
jgi:DHA1 family bicyclomycin/chloramphenicol resistance-like MFS transporter